MASSESEASLQRSAYVGHDGRRGEARFLPGGACADEPGAALVWAGALGDAGEAELFAAWHDAGIAVLAVDAFASAADTPDRAAVADLEAAFEHLGSRPELDLERIAVAGVGRGGTRALLFACSSRRVAAAVQVAGPLVHAELSRERPAQPYELAANLSCPLLALFGSEDPATPPQHLELFERTLGPWMKTYELETIEGAGPGLLDPASGGYHQERAQRTRERILRFLRECLELP